MVDILFEGNRAGNFDLTTCLENGILPMPTYVATMYSLDQEFKKQEDKINHLGRDYDKHSLLNSLKEAKINWEKSFNFDKTLHHFLSPFSNGENNTKILIFCKSKTHLKEIRKVFDPVFKMIFKNCNDILIDEYYTGMNDDPFVRFRDRYQRNSVQILYSIDKLVEGVHIDSLNAIIMLRETESEIIYFQQIGRVLSIGGSKHPLVIDFVNNFDNVKNYHIWNNLMQVKHNYPMGEFMSQGQDSRTEKVYFYNFVKDPMEIFNQINQKIKDSQMHTYNGETNTLHYFAKKHHKSYEEIRYKVKNQGMTIEEAIVTSDDVDDTVYQYSGQQGTIMQLCTKFKKNYELVKYRLKCGKTLEEAMK